MSKLINGSTAHKEMIKANIIVSYPTAMKKLKELGIATQPLGHYGQIQVDSKKLFKWIEDQQGIEK